MGYVRDRAWRRKMSRKHINIQWHIYRVNKGSASIHDAPLPRWRKLSALGCGNANCGLCRNPRFNRNFAGELCLTLQERRAIVNFKEWVFEKNI